MTFRLGALLACLAVVAAPACAATRERPPCDASTLVGIIARCIAVMPECPADLNEPCPEYDACMAELDERQSECLAR